VNGLCVPDVVIVVAAVAGAVVAIIRTAPGVAGPCVLSFFLYSAGDRKI
jgi:hypothetical protein